MAFHYVERRPAAPLRPFVECFWAVSDDDARERSPDRIVPDGCPELIVHRGDVFSRVHEGRSRPQPNAFLAGALTRPWTIRSGRRLETVGVRLRPGAATALLGVPLGEATDVETPLDELVGRRGRSFAETVRGAPSLDAALGAAESVVSGWLGAGDRPASPAVAALLSSRGKRPVADVAKDLGWSLRRLERVFRDEVGLPPKLFARIVRLNAALASLPEEGRVDLVDVALDCGYFDQSHLLRDFRLLVGASPARARLQPVDGLASRLTRPARLRSLLVGE